MALSLTILGCDGSWPSPGGACSSYLLRTETTAVLVDAGSGSMANLQRHMDPKDLDAIIVTHEDPDHASELVNIDIYLEKNSAGRAEVITYAADGVKEQIFPRVEPLALHWNVLEDGDELEIGDIVFRTSRTDHGPVTYGLRIESGGRVLGFTADTGPGWDMSVLGNDLDVAMCDALCSAETTAVGHCNSVQAATLASNTGATRLFLTHIRHGYDKDLVRSEAQDNFTGEVTIIKTGDTYQI